MSAVIENKERIENCSKEIENQQDNMEKIRAQITDASKPFIKDTIKKLVEEQVKKDPVHTKELGLEKLAAMKQDLKVLLEGSDKTVDDILSNNCFWVHPDYRIESYADEYSQLYEAKEKWKKRIAEGFRMVVGHAGQLLQKYEYKTGNNTMYQLPYSNPAHGLPILLTYKGYLSIPSEVDALMKQYLDGLTTLHNLCKKLYGLNQELAEQEAADLWDQV